MFQSCQLTLKSPSRWWEKLGKNKHKRKDFPSISEQLLLKSDYFNVTFGCGAKYFDNDELER